MKAFNRGQRKVGSPGLSLSERLISLRAVTVVYSQSNMYIHMSQNGKDTAFFLGLYHADACY